MIDKDKDIFMIPFNQFFMEQKNGKRLEISFVTENQITILVNILTYIL